jgi:hypothetical protein
MNRRAKGSGHMWTPLGPVNALTREGTSQTAHLPHVNP